MSSPAYCSRFARSFALASVLAFACTPKAVAQDEPPPVTRPFTGPQFRFGVRLGLEAIMGTTFGAMATADLLLGARLARDLSLVAHITGPDAGAWDRGGGDALAGFSATIGIEHLGLNRRAGQGVSVDLGVGAWVIDERLGIGSLGALPFASIHIVMLVLHDPAYPLLGTPSTGVTFGVAIDPDRGVALFRLGLEVIGFELTAGSVNIDPVGIPELRGCWEPRDGSDAELCFEGDGFEFRLVNGRVVSGSFRLVDEVHLWFTPTEGEPFCTRILGSEEGDLVTSSDLANGLGRCPPTSVPLARWGRGS
jgi:hypothetical protein